MLNRPPGSSRYRGRRSQVGRAAPVFASTVVALSVLRPGLAAPPPRAATELGAVLEELESFSDRMGAAVAGDQGALRGSALRILREFELRLPDLRGRSRDALSGLHWRIERESGLIEHEQRVTAAAVEKLQEMRRSRNTEALRARPSSPREELVRTLTGRLVAELLLLKEREAARSAASLDERSRRNRAVDRELLESSARLESLFLRIETALPRVVSLLAPTPSVGAAPTLGGPRRLVMALDRIQTALLDVMEAHVATLEAMNVGSASRDAPGSGGTNTHRARERDELAATRLPDASSLRVRSEEDESSKRPDSLPHSDTTKGRN